jgi:hypothetical protein
MDFFFHGIVNRIQCIPQYRCLTIFVRVEAQKDDSESVDAL